MSTVHTGLEKQKLTLEYNRKTVRNHFKLWQMAPQIYATNSIMYCGSNNREIIVFASLVNTTWKPKNRSIRNIYRRMHAMHLQTEHGVFSSRTEHNAVCKFRDVCSLVSCDETSASDFMVQFRMYLHS
jgi:hypothetical protein